MGKEQMAQKNQISANAPKSRIGKRIRVLLADDHAIVRQSLCSLLQCESDFEVVGEAENGRHAIDLARQHSPEVVIMDVNMPVMNGIEATRILTKEMPEIKVIALSMHLEKDAMTGIREAGAMAYLAKGCSTDELVTAIRTCNAKPPKDM
jgi:DNA-binding NarL/FixJ family response regulator